MYSEFTQLRSSQNGEAITGTNNNELQLEQENFRKKVKRLTGELDVLETYFENF